ncbi:SAM-dependent methyltransferase [Actinoplanes sp. LDG1-06]|uniref:SAM-dependent methyltransferase n=1 Tax=Paractinoplanes ovalisporus TaxID=2810368 RepID=A0ABS2AW47_9ACTN|nr:SAM-dependent methyltransferase [Actinoplanes ovalisporus]MBM2623436.1 SAM-dependent methyltransferase [Actinoplanes ovalisporus]
MSDRPPLDVSVPNAARRYNYLLSGKDNFALDRDSAHRIERFLPAVRVAASQNRKFLHRAVEFLTENGVTQFLDVGAGLPAVVNTHEVAQRINPSARVVYVDNDPIVAAHGRAWLAPPNGVCTAMVEADLRHPATIVNDPDLHAVLDLTKPVGLLLVAVLHYLADGDQPHKVVRQLIDALPVGSWLVVSHGTADLLEPALADGADIVVKQAGIPMALRSRDDIASFLQGLELVDPGLVPVQRWRPGDPVHMVPADTDVGIYGGVACKHE